MQTVIPKILEDTMYYRNIPVFIYKINYPFFTTTCDAAAGQSINNHYSKLAIYTENYCRTILYHQALESAKYIQNHRTYQSYTMNVNYKITYNSRCITSLYMDTYTYMGGAHGETTRTSDTWDFHTGAQLQLNDFYPLFPSSLDTLLNFMEQKTAEKIKKSPGSYFDDYKALLPEAFNQNNYYLQPGYIVIYYQQYDIAPYSSGIPEFYFPMHPN